MEVLPRLLQFMRFETIFHAYFQTLFDFERKNDYLAAFSFRQVRFTTEFKIFF